MSTIAFHFPFHHIQLRPRYKAGMGNLLERCVPQLSRLRIHRVGIDCHAATFPDVYLQDQPMAWVARW